MLQQALHDRKSSNIESSHRVPDYDLIMYQYLCINMDIN
jgi:hypothetical protein